MKPASYPQLLLAALLTLLSANLAAGQEKESSKAKAWLGIATYQYKEQRDSAARIYVDLVWPDSPAGTAGLKEGDRLISLNGTKIRSAAHIVRLIKKSKPGAEVELKWMRKDKSHQKKVKLAKYEGDKFEQIELAARRDWKRNGKKFIDPAELSEEEAEEIWYEVEDRVDVMLLRMGFSPDHCDRILEAIAVGEAELRKPAQKALGKKPAEREEK